MVKREIKKIKEQKVTLNDIHEKVVIVVGTTDLILSQQNELSKVSNTLSTKHNELLEELKIEIKHGNESRSKQNESINEQTKVLSQMTQVLGKATENNTNERIAQNDKGFKILLIIFLAIVIGLLLLSGVIVWQDVKEIKEILPIIG